MARKIISVRKIPKRYIRIERTKSTVGTRNKKDGTMTGRKVTSGQGDSTRTIRLIKSVDLNKNGHIDSSEHGGLILGRASAVKSSNRAKGYTRKMR